MCCSHSKSSCQDRLSQAGRYANTALANEVVVNSASISTQRDKEKDPSRGVHRELPFQDTAPNLVSGFFLWIHAEKSLTVVELLTLVEKNSQELDFNG